MGFMWFGTSNGLIKYDGTSLNKYQYNPLDSFSISSNYVVKVFEDSFGCLWVGNGYEGLNRFERQSETFIRYQYDPDKKESISSNNIRAVFEDSRKNLWIGTAGGGLNLYSRGSDSFIRYLDDRDNMSDIGSNYTVSIAEDMNGYLWLGSSEGILTKFNTETRTGKSFRLYTNYEADLFNTIFSKVYIDPENNVWFGTQNGLFLFDQKTESFKHFKKGNTNKDLNSNDVSSVLELENNIYMITTDHGGLNFYDKKKDTFTYSLSSPLDASTISNNQLYSTYKSPDGIIWIGSYQGGVNILDMKSNKFQQYKNLVDRSEFLNCLNSVLTIAEDKDRNIWIGLDGQGIQIMQPDTWKISHLKTDKNNMNTIPGDIVTEIYRDRNDDMWIGTYLGGLARRDNKTGQYTRYFQNQNNPESIGGNNIWSITEDSDGIFWLATMGNGIDRFDRKTNIFKHFKNNPDDPGSISNNDVFKVFIDKSGQLWAGTRNGLCLLDKSTGRFTRFMSGTNSQNSIYGSWIHDIYEDTANNLWIGTDLALNLYHPENKTFEHFDENDGLKSSVVLGITGDKQNNLWVSTYKGLSKFNIALKKFQNFDIADGLQSNEFNYTSVLKSSDGRLYFGGRKGLNVFHPDSIKDNTRIPPVYFTQVSVANSPVSPRQHSSVIKENINFAKTITLTHKQATVLSFQFAALNYSNPQKNQYAYMLEGFNDDWINIGSRHEITFTNLNPGKYLLRIRGSNNDNIWNETGNYLQIVIFPPWWKTWWFKTLFYFSVACLLFLVYYLRIVFYHNQQKKLMLLVRERTIQLEESAVKLEENQEEINSQNEELILQKDELFKHRNQLESLVEERTKELIEAKNKAEQADRLKSSFLSNLSHEIRTPLNAILGFSSMLGEKGISESERDEYEMIVQDNSNNLLALINDILDISKIEAGQMELVLKPVLLESVVNNLVGVYNMLIKRDNTSPDKPVTLKINIQKEILNTEVITDKLRLEQVLSNLVSNAVKFTKQGFIEIGCTRLPENNMLEFYVKDTGIGIEEENLSLVFERFRKIEDDKSQLYRGTGLGLAISSQLVKLLGGSMYLTSKPGEGSVFYFTIPLIMSATPASPSRDKKPVNTFPDLSDYRILVAEDDLSSFWYIENLLKKTRASIFHASNGKEVLNILQNHNRVNLILMDIKMPVMDGIEALHELRNMSFEIPVIAQTAYALANDIEKLKFEGFDEYISKPINPQDFYMKISQFLKSN